MIVMASDSDPPANKFGLGLPTVRDLSPPRFANDPRAGSLDHGVPAEGDSRSEPPEEADPAPQDEPAGGPPGEPTVETPLPKFAEPELSTPPPALLHETQTNLAAGVAESAVFVEGYEFRGRYVIGSLLGQGGQGEVYAARDRATGRRVALKVVRRSCAGRAEIEKRLLREGRMIRSLNQHHLQAVVEIYEVDADPSFGAFIVMERIEGETLEQVMATYKGKMPPLLALTLVARAAEAMEGIHAFAIVHRDLKPSNVILTRNADGTPRLVILDLGLARTADSSNLTSRSVVIGTAHYIAPEQVGNGTTSARSDVYSLACVLYHMLQAHWVFAEKEAADPTAKAIAQCGWHLYATIPMPDRIPVIVWNVLARALEKNPELRYASCLDFARALRRIARDLEQGKLTREDLMPAVDSDKARPSPKPIIDEKKRARLPELVPFEAKPDQMLDVPSVLVVGGPRHHVGRRWAIGRDVVIGRALPRRWRPNKRRSRSPWAT
jgi:serine/threonine protein kinase